MDSHQFYSVILPNVGFLAIIEPAIDLDKDAPVFLALFHLAGVLTVIDLVSLNMLNLSSHLRLYHVD